MLEQLEVYISAQKTVASYIMGAGLVFLFMATLLYFTQANSLFNGLKIGLIVVGYISLGSGYAYRITEIKLFEKQTKLYSESPAKFHEIEKNRMEKVVKNFPLYQIAMTAIIAICLIVIFFLNNSFVNGVLFSLTLFLLGNLIIEKVSKSSIYEYHHQLND